MLRLYQLISVSLGRFMERHERNLFTTGARLMALICICVAFYYAYRLGSQLF